MDIKEIRRRRLKEWFADKKLPQKDSSYISQVINGKSIGEKAARRLETENGMPEMFLDTPFGENNKEEPVTLTERQRKILELLDSLPDDEVDDFLSKISERVEFYNRRLKQLYSKIISEND